MAAVADDLEIDFDLLEKLAEENGIRRLWLFGSAARGELRDDSDVDVLVEWKPGETAREAYLVGLTLPPAFDGREVDLVDRRKLRESVRRRVELDMRLIYEAGHAMPPTNEPNNAGKPTGKITQEERDIDRLCHMLTSAEQVEQFAAGVERAAFLADRRERLAWVHLLQIIGEAATKISKPTRALLPGVDWQNVTTFRHRAVHDYDQIDFGIVYDIATTEMRPLIEETRKFLDARGVDCSALDNPWLP